MIFGCKNQLLFLSSKIFWQNKLDRLLLARLFTPETSFIEWGDIFGCKNQHFLLSCGCSGKISLSVYYWQDYLQRRRAILNEVIFSAVKTNTFCCLVDVRAK